MWRIRAKHLPAQHITRASRYWIVGLAHFEPCASCVSRKFRRAEERLNSPLAVWRLEEETRDCEASRSASEAVYGSERSEHTPAGRVCTVGGARWRPVGIIFGRAAFDAPPQCASLRGSASIARNLLRGVLAHADLLRHRELS